MAWSLEFAIGSCFCRHPLGGRHSDSIHMHQSTSWNSCDARHHVDYAALIARHVKRTRGHKRLLQGAFIAIISSIVCNAASGLLGVKCNIHRGYRDETGSGIGERAYVMPSPSLKFEDSSPLAEKWPSTNVMGPRRLGPSCNENLTPRDGPCVDDRFLYTLTILSRTRYATVPAYFTCRDELSVRQPSSSSEASYVVSPHRFLRGGQFAVTPSINPRRDSNRQLPVYCCAGLMITWGKQLATNSALDTVVVRFPVSSSVPSAPSRDKLPPWQPTKGTSPGTRP